MADQGLRPSAMREVCEIDWTNQASIARVEQIAKDVFTKLAANASDSVPGRLSLPSAPKRKKDLQVADVHTIAAQARAWTLGALLSAFPRSQRDSERARMTELVTRATTFGTSTEKKPAKRPARRRS